MDLKGIASKVAGVDIKAKRAYLKAVEKLDKLPDTQGKDLLRAVHRWMYDPSDQKDLAGLEEIFRDYGVSATGSETTG